MITKEEIQKELLERIHNHLLRSIKETPPKPFGIGSKDYVTGLVTALGIVDAYDPSYNPQEDNNRVGGNKN